MINKPFQRPSFNVRISGKSPSGVIFHFRAAEARWSGGSEEATLAVGSKGRHWWSEGLAEVVGHAGCAQSVPP